MDITPTTTIITNINNTATPTTTIAIAAAATSSKSPEHETETPPRIANTTTPPPTKALSFSNGVLKRHHPSSYHHHHPLSANHTTMAVAYKECLKNHAANLGGHALDGCGEFMPAPSATAADPSSLKCAACGCHRNFHRREPEEPPISTAVIEYQPHHRHHPPPPPSFQPSSRSPNSASPPPISSSYYPSAPHMLLALSTGLAAPPENAAGPTSSSRKRFRTKFSQEQKEKMLKFAERVGWKMQKKDEDFVQDFCNEIGIERGVLKVWMHNNKNTFGKRDGSNEINNNNINNNINNAGSAKSFFAKENHDPVITNINSASEINGNGNRNHGAEDPIHHHYQNDGGATVRANGSSSS